MSERKMLTGHTPDILRRKLEDFIARLTKRFGDMKGKVEVSTKPGVSFADIGDLARAKQEIAGLVFALKSPDLHKKWGTQPPNGVLLYGTIPRPPAPSFSPIRWRDSNGLPPELAALIIS